MACVYHSWLASYQTDAGSKSYVVTQVSASDWLGAYPLEFPSRMEIHSTVQPLLSRESTKSCSLPAASAQTGHDIEVKSTNTMSYSALP
jgi:hypothetical protein